MKNNHKNSGNFVLQLRQRAAHTLSSDQKKEKNKNIHKDIEHSVRQPHQLVVPALYTKCSYLSSFSWLGEENIKFLKLNFTGPGLISTKTVLYKVVKKLSSPRVLRLNRSFEELLGLFKESW